MFDNTEKAMAHIRPLIGLSPGKLAEVPDVDLKRAWAAIFYVFPGLHPEETVHKNLSHIKLAADMPQSGIATPYFASSGWPQKLVPIQREMWRRYSNSKIDELDMYPHEAQVAGIENAHNN